VTATLIVAALGILGTLAGAILGPFVTTRFTEQREHRARLRDARTLLYIDVNSVATAYGNFLRMLIGDEYQGLPRRDRLDVAETIDGRVHLLASGEIRDVWLELRESMRELDWFVFEARGVEPGRGMNDNDPMLARPRELIHRLYELTRQAAERS
jgi:hypothetical protein